MMHDGEHPLNQSRETNMKQIRLTKILAASLVCAASFGVVLAQTSTTTTTTDPVTGTTTTQQTTTSSAGNIVTYTPDSDYFMFRTASGAAPVRYYYTKDTTVVDPSGRVVTLSAIRPDMPRIVRSSVVLPPPLGPTIAMPRLGNRILRRIAAQKLRRRVELAP